MSDETPLWRFFCGIIFDMAETNPNKANQWRPDPRQDLFLSKYLDPNSPTWSNAYQSALQAGYEDEYAKALLSKMPTWLAEKVKDTQLVSKALRNLEMGLEGMLDDPEKGGKPLQSRLTEFTLKGLQKTKWSERYEHTGKDGEPLRIEVSEALLNKHNDSNSSTK